MSAQLSTGDRVIVVRTAEFSASASLHGRSGTIVLVQAERALAGVQLEQGTVHTMPLACLRRVELPRVR